MSRQHAATIAKDVTSGATSAEAVMADTLATGAGGCVAWALRTPAPP